MGRKAWLFLVTLVVVGVLDPAVAWGGNQGGGGLQGWGGGALGRGGATVGVLVSAGSNTTSTVPKRSRVSQPQSLPRFYVDTVPCPMCASGGLVCLGNGTIGHVAPTGGPLPPGESEPSSLVLVNPRTGAVPPQVDQLVCPAPAPPPPPPPPSPQQVMEQVEFPAPSVELSPARIGVVQLPTWFWLGNDAATGDFKVGPIGVGGYYVVLTAHPAAYYWSFGDGLTAVSDSAGGPGGAGAAAVVHTYREKGTYAVGVDVAWVGSYTFYGHGIHQTVALGPVEQGEVYRSYTVQEIRSVLTQEGP